ncbi:hypothetical protein JHK87_031781 [Glycine soja]|nr:hypothetical protein JHK87_031781 [Glycine soja]
MTNREAWKLEKEVKKLILQGVKERKETSFEKDLLQMVLEGARNSNLSQEATNRFIVDSCKNIYLAGYETTVVATAWYLMLLASNQNWHDRVRAEVLEICRDSIPNFTMLCKMKQPCVPTTNVETWVSSPSGPNKSNP